MFVELRRFAHRSIVVLSLAAALVAGTAQPAAPETNFQLIEELRAGKRSVAQAAWWGFRLS